MRRLVQARRKYRERSLLDLCLLVRALSEPNNLGKFPYNCGILLEIEQDLFLGSNYFVGIRAI